MKDQNSYDIYLKDIKKVAYLSAEEEKALFEKAQKGDMKARNRIIESALHFVISLAKKFNLPKVFSFNDLVGYGNEGLMEAFNHYKPGNNARFITYAYFWIYKYMNDALHNYGRLVRLPQNWEERLSRVFKSMEYLESFESTDSKGTAAFFMSESDKIRYVAQKMGMKTSEIDRLILAAVNPRSLDDLISAADSGDNGDTFGSQVSAQDPDPEECLYNSMLPVYVNELLDSMPPLYAKVLSERNGLDGKGCRSLRQLGDEIGVSKEQIRTYERQAISYARSLARKMELDSYIAA